jgi:hypothetical protein
MLSLESDRHWPKAQRPKTKQSREQEGWRRILRLFLLWANLETEADYAERIEKLT